MKTFYLQILIGCTALLLLVSTLGVVFLNGPTEPDGTYSPLKVKLSSQVLTGSYYGQPISEHIGRRMVPHVRSVQW